MFSGDGLRPVGHPERCVQIRGERGSDEGGAKKLNVESYDLLGCKYHFFVCKLKHISTNIANIVFLSDINSIMPGDPGRERRPVGGDATQAYCRRQPERHTEAEGRQKMTMIIMNMVMTIIIILKK